MRAGPLSSPKVISLLNRYFVPVYVSNEDYSDERGGSAPAGEKAEYRRIYHEALQRGLSTGTVHVYLLSSDAHPIDSLHVATAARPERLIDLLERTVAKLGIPEGKPLVEPAPRSKPPAAPEGSLVLHLTARYLPGGGSWREFPGEDWLVLDRDQWSKLLPEGDVEPGRSWEIDVEVARGILTHFYPPTENNDVTKNQFETLSVKATVVSKEATVVRARIDGRLRMKHPFYHKDDDKFVAATVVGYLDFEQNGKEIHAVRLVTEKATYGGVDFGVAVRSVP